MKWCWHRYIENIADSTDGLWKVLYRTCHKCGRDVFVKVLKRPGPTTITLKMTAEVKNDNPR